MFKYIKDRMRKNNIIPVVKNQLLMGKTIVVKINGEEVTLTNLSYHDTFISEYGDEYRVYDIKTIEIVKINK